MSRRVNFSVEESENELGDDAVDAMEEKLRLAKITAEQIVREILHLALENMLQQADAGTNTENILKAFKTIELSGKESHPLPEQDFDVTLLEMQEKSIKKLFLAHSGSHFLPRTSSNVENIKGKSAKAKKTFDMTRL